MSLWVLCVLLAAVPVFKPGDIRIEGGQAFIHWSLDEHLLTRVLVRACLANDPANCAHTNVTDLSLTPVTVDLPSGGDTYLFNFDLYAGEDMVNQKLGVKGKI